MLVVADASPLHYLILLGEQRLLEELFQSVSIPAAVANELSHERAPATVRQFITSPPTWLVVRSESASIDLPHLDAGETAAICLAHAIQADLLLIDERRGTEVARALGIPAVGVVGLLEFAASRKSIDLRIAFDRLLSETNFRVRPSFLAERLVRFLASSDES